MNDAVSDRGARALAERLCDWDPAYTPEDDVRHICDEHRMEASRVLGTTGLFIADVTEHEPRADGVYIGCVCGWAEVWSSRNESYFDHIGGTP